MQVQVCHIWTRPMATVNISVRLTWSLLKHSKVVLQTKVMHLFIVIIGQVKFCKDTTEYSSSRKCHPSRLLNMNSSEVF